MKTSQSLRLTLPAVILSASILLAGCGGDTAVPTAVSTAVATAGAAVATVAVAATEASGAAMATTAPAAAATAVPATADASLPAGETKTLGTLKLTLHSVKAVAGKDTMQPAAGAKFLQVTATLENAGTQVENLSSFVDTMIRDGAGKKYNESMTGDMVALGHTLGGTLKPGEKVTGTATYEVPEGAQGLQWVYSHDFGQTEVTFALKP